MESKPAKPRDAHTIEAILHTMGVDDYDPRVVNQLLELLHRYVSSVLLDARQLSEHAEKPAIDVDDVKLAIRTRCTHSFTQPPPRDVTMNLASERNSIPLPPVDQKAGTALPPPDEQLTAQNYTVVIDANNSSPKRRRLTSSPGRPSPTGSRQKSPHSAQKNTSSPHASAVPTPSGMPPPSTLARTPLPSVLSTGVSPSPQQATAPDDPMLFSRTSPGSRSLPLSAPSPSMPSVMRPGQQQLPQIGLTSAAPASSSAQNPNTLDNSQPDKAL